jgi:hypothetical protein
MLREKLVIVTGDLVTAKGRVRELELNVLDDKKTLKQSAETLLASSTFFLDQLRTSSIGLLMLGLPGQQISEMASFLNKQKQESLDALTCASEAESRLHIVNEQ